MDAIKAYIETALRIANAELEASTDPIKSKQIGLVIVYLTTALDAIINDYSA